MQQTCRHCQQSFEITDDDLAFYEKVSPVFNGKKEPIPPPTMCPECRIQRHFTWRNERNLIRRTCDSCKKSVVSIYHDDASFLIYCNDCWWGNSWDAMHFGRDVDFSKSFFAQLREIRSIVPRNALYLNNAINSDYCNHSLDLKDCYLCACVGNNTQNGYYSKWILGSRDFSDCYQLVDSELCYESLYSNNCYHCISAIRSQECRDSAFLYDCIGCSDCFQCWNLRHKRFHIQNVAYSEEEYRRRMKEIYLSVHDSFANVRKEFFTLIETRAIHQSQFNKQCEDVSGDFLVRCKNVHDSFDVEDAQDCRYCYGCGGIKDCYDINEAAIHCELQYDCQSCDKGQRTLFSHTSYYDSDMILCDSCHSCSNVFGCIGMRNARYCILNKQYTKEEYNDLVPKIIAKMRADGEWGEFFPVTMSPFAYNETVAQEYFPMTKEEVLARGWKWRDQTDEMPKVERIIPAVQLPDSIDDIPDDILNWAIECEATKRPFKIIKQELEFYRQMRLPVPHFHPDERHRRRMALRNPRKLWKRECMKCGKAIETSYSPDRPEIVYCESCYLAAVY